MAIDWSRVGAGIERAGARWSGSIMDELQAKKAEERAIRMFKFKLGEETKARKSLMEEGNRIALDLERGKAVLGSELQTYLGSQQLQAYMTEVSKPGRPELQIQALGTRDLIGRLQRFERTTPEDARLVQSLPLDVQAPIATAMGTVNKYYQKEDAVAARFKKQGEYQDAQIGHLQILTDTLRGRAGGAITPEQARKLLDSSTKGLVTLQGDEYFQILLRKTSRKEELKPEEKVAWQDFMLRYQLLHGSINAARQVLSGGILPPQAPAQQREVVAPRPKGKFAKAFTEGWFPEEGWKGNVDRFVQDLITKGYVGVQEGSKDFMIWFKKLIQSIEKGEWLEPVS